MQVGVGPEEGESALGDEVDVAGEVPRPAGAGGVVESGVEAEPDLMHGLTLSHSLSLSRSLSPLSSPLPLFLSLSLPLSTNGVEVEPGL